MSSHQSAAIAAVGDRPVARVLVTNTVWNYIGFGVNVASNLLLFPFVVAKMGDAAAGIWLLVGSVSGYMGLLQLGVAPSLTQFAAASIARSERDALNRSASTALALMSSLGCLALLALPAIPRLLDLFHISAASRPDATIAFVLGIIGVPLQMPGQIFNALLSAGQRQDLCSKGWIFSLAGKFVGVFALLSMGFGLPELMWLETALIIASGSFLAWMAFKNVPGLRVSLSAVNAEDARRLSTLGGWFFVVALCSLLIEQTDRVVVGAFLSVEAVTHYSAGWKLYVLVYGVSTTLIQAVGPVAAAYVAREDEPGLQRLFLRMTRYAAAVAIPMVCGLALCATLVLRVWMGSAFVDDYRIVQVLLATFLVTAFNHVAQAILAAMRRVQQVVWRYSLPQALLNAVLSIWLVQRLGIIGVALGTMVPAWLLQYTFMSYTLSQLRLSWRDLFVKVVWPTVAPAFVAFLPTLAVYILLGRHSWWLVPAAGASGLLYVALFWKMLDPSERTELWTHVESTVSRRAAT
jgi:O-antigen/teichoic acid export membrane protein